MASSINKIKLKNFKAFYGEETIELDARHLLLYGENGSGKSSIYWALYTLMQSATKEQSEIAKYFIPINDEHLINHDSLKEHVSFAIDGAGKITDPESIGLNASVKIELANTNSATISSVGKTDTASILEDLNRYSDFISHRLLINFYNFRNSRQINLWEVFVRDIFPFLMTDAGNETLGQVYNEIESSKPFFKFTGSKFKVKRTNSQVRVDYNDRITFLNANLDRWIADINGLVDDFYNTHFKDINEPSLKIEIDYNIKLAFGDIFQQHNRGNNTHFMWDKKHVDLNNPFIRLNISQADTAGNFVLVERPQSFFNEAKLTQIALSVRFSLLDDSIRPKHYGQFLALDDLLVSLDMSNRDKVLDIILKDFAPKYKIYLFTHERAFFDFCKFKIKQYKSNSEWNLKEMYSSNESNNKPIIIPHLDEFQKAQKYFEAKDYTASAIYIRKEIEKLVNKRLPDELKFKTDGTFLTLQTMWNNLVIRYTAYNKPISKELKDLFSQTKLLVLNTQAHFQSISVPLYKFELLKAFELVEKIKVECPIPINTILLGKGMKLKYKHHTEDYSLTIELNSDFSINTFNTIDKQITLPKCKIIHWQFRSQPFINFKNFKTVNYKLSKPKIHKLDLVFDTILKTPFENSIDDVLDNFIIEDGLWTLKEIVQKANLNIRSHYILDKTIVELN